MNNNNSQGRHRAVVVAARSSVVATAAMSVAVAFAGTAFADDVQPGLSTTTPQQPGLSTTTPAPAPVVEPDGGYVAGYTPLYDYTETRTVEDYNAGRQTPSYQSEPVYYDTTPAPVQGPGIGDRPDTDSPAPQPEPEPTPAPTVKKTKIVPIQTPPDSILIGANVVRTPDFVDPVFARQVSNTFSAFAADGGNLLVDNGLADAPRADRIAVGTAGGAVTGTLVGLGVGLVPGAAITLGGAAIGAGLGVAATPVLTPAIIWGGPLGYVFVPGAAALAGAGVGAAVSAPIVAATTVIGAVTGGLIGGAAAGGEAITVEEPAPAPTPAIEAPPVGSPADQLPIIPAPLTTEPAPDLLAQANTAAANAAPVVQQAIDDANTWTAPATAAVEGFTSAVLEQPAVADAAAAAGPALTQAADALGGALAGLGVARV